MHPGERVQKLSHRGKLAIRLLVTGACKTMREASEAAGLHPMYLQYLIKSEPAKAFVKEQEDKMSNATVNMSAAIAALSHRALNTVVDIMDKGAKEEVRLRAAVDLLDRNPNTSKIQKHQVESLTLGARDAKALADALVESAKAQHQYNEAAAGNFIRIQDNKPKEIPPHATGSSGE